MKPKYDNTPVLHFVHRGVTEVYDTKGNRVDNQKKSWIKKLLGI